MDAALQLVPGVTRLRPDDHFMILSETDASPMHVGALLLFDVPRADQPGFFAAFARQLAERLPATPLLVTLAQAPDGFDSDVWVDAPSDAVEPQIERVDAVLDDAALYADVARRNMLRLNPARPPFHATVYDRLTANRAAVYFKAHHAIADGIGFQAVLHALSDAAAPVPPRAAAAALPAPDTWAALAEARFAAQAPLREAHATQRKAAAAALDALKADPTAARAPTPSLKLSGPTSPQRVYALTSLSLARVKALGIALGATVNDIFLALAATALRRILIDIDALPDTPLVANSARSYRRPEHGAFGNRIVALHPQLATTIADPLDRLRAIQAAMTVERRRTGFDEAFLDAPETPFGARDRRARFAARAAGGGALLPGNVTLSNVPGPAERLRFAGFTATGNYPVPIIGSARFLNITSRRSGDHLDIGVIADPTKIADVARVAASLHDALATYEALA